MFQMFKSQCDYFHKSLVNKKKHTLTKYGQNSVSIIINKKKAVDGSGECGHRCRDQGDMRTREKEH